MNKGISNVYLIVALVATSFAAGRFYANSSLMEENQKLKESVRLLRGEKISGARGESGVRPWREEKPRPSPAMTPATEPARESETSSLVAAPPPATAPTATAPAATLAAVNEKPRAEPVVHDAPANPAAAVQPEAEPAPAREAPEAAPPPPVANGRKTGKKWVSDLGDQVQGTATYWHCNNATLVASGMEYYAYGSIPASRLKKQDDAYSVRDGKAIVISGCWSPKLGKAILYRKSDGRRWEPAFNLADGSWMPAAD